jgi:hypothetical protein
MARKSRRRSRLRPAPFFVLFLLANLAVGLTVSRITAIRSVRVDGATAWDEPRLEGILSELRGVPCAKVNRFHIESRVLENPEVKSASFDRSIFGSALLTVRYRTPAARFFNHDGLALSDEGVIYRSVHLPPNLPAVLLGSGQPGLLFTLANNWPSGSIAYVAVQVRRFVPAETVRIDYGTGSSLCLNIGTGKAIFGSCEGLDAKLKKLHDKLQTDPDYLSKIDSLNLVDPDNPMVVPK